MNREEKRVEMLLENEVLRSEYGWKKYDDVLEEVYANKIHLSIAMHCLKKLASLGNMNAYDLYLRQNKTVSYEDLAQDILVELVTIYNEDPFAFSFDEDTHKLYFSDDEYIKRVFGVVSHTLYQMLFKHYSHMFIEIDGDIVDVNKVSELSTYCDIENLNTNLDYYLFRNRLQSFDCDWLDYRLLGYSNRAIAGKMHVTYEKIRATEKRVRRIWGLWIDADSNPLYNNSSSIHKVNAKQKSINKAMKKRYKEVVENEQISKPKNVDVKVVKAYAKKRK